MGGSHDLLQKLAGYSRIYNVSIEYDEMLNEIRVFGYGFTPGAEAAALSGIFPGFEITASQGCTTDLYVLVRTPDGGLQQEGVSIDS